MRPGESPALFHRWFGIARVIGHDFRDPEKMADGINATLRPAAVQGSPHGIWLRYGAVRSWRDPSSFGLHPRTSSSHGTACQQINEERHYHEDLEDSLMYDAKV